MQPFPVTQAMIHGNQYNFLYEDMNYLSYLWNNKLTKNEISLKLLSHFSWSVQRTGAVSSICVSRLLWNENAPRRVSSYSVDLWHNERIMYFLTTFARTIVWITKKRKILLIQIRELLKLPKGFQPQMIHFTLLWETYLEKVPWKGLIFSGWYCKNRILE